MDNFSTAKGFRMIAKKYLVLKILWAIIRGRGMFSTFKALNLTCLHVLRASMVYVTLWYVHVPLEQTEQT